MLKSPPKYGTNRQTKAVDMVTRLYVYTLKTDTQISSAEIGILYSLLTNLFAHVDLSWEAYVSDVINSDYDINEVLDYLNTHLSPFDKARILLSLAIMAKTEGDIRISELTELLELCKRLEVNSEGFMQLIDHLETGGGTRVCLPCEHHITHVRHSLFSDYVVFGTSPSADIRFRNTELTSYEGSLFAIDRHLFFAVGGFSTARVDGIQVKANNITLLKGDCTLSIGGTDFHLDCLRKIYDQRDTDDEIVFRKSTYDFLVNKRKLRYSLLPKFGSISLNGRDMITSSHYERHYQLYYDDTIQIKGYAPWNLTVLIESRSSIGLDDFIPKAMYINFQRDYYSITRHDTANSILSVDLKDGAFWINPPKPGWTVSLNREELKEPLPLKLNSDLITIKNRNFRINSFYDLIESPLEIQNITLTDVKHYFSDGQLALDSISYEVNKGELIGIMGPSGCGKSTLVKLLSGDIIPTYGQITVDGKNFYENLNLFLEYFAYVPQDDLLYPNLTVWENLWYRLQLRMPNFSMASLHQKIDNILHQVNLTHQRNTLVGEFSHKNLSGGERKRLNIALELLFEPTLIICDEPTSGLSFTDAEQIVDILDALSQQGKIVLITIHQPNSSIYRKFDKVLLMDMGGKMVYYGSPEKCFDYFDEELAQLTHRKGEIERKRHLMTSDFMYDVITYPEYNDLNEPVYEQINRYIQPKRKFSPDYWRDKYKRKVLFEMIQHELRSAPVPPISTRRRRPKRRPKDHLIIFLAYLKRSFKMKLRNRTNSIITFIQAPLLATVIAFILRYAPPGEKYSFAQNNNIGIYVFVSVIAFIFLGLSNSIEEILDERKIIIREQLLKLNIRYYQFSKMLTLSLFTLLQAIIYHFLASLILGIRGMNLISIIYLAMAGLTGNTLGLMASAFIREKKAIINLLPLILIPQIIFGGAVIEFERMNRDLTIFYANPVPEIVQTIPSRWLFEGYTTAFAKHSAFHRGIEHLEAEIETKREEFTNGKISGTEYQAFKNRIYDMRQKVITKWDPDKVQNFYLTAAVSLMDGEVLSSKRNVFLSSYKTIGNGTMRSWYYNLIIILLYQILFSLITAIKLRYFFKD